MFLKNCSRAGEIMLGLGTRHPPPNCSDNTQRFQEKPPISQPGKLHHRSQDKLYWSVAPNFHQRELRCVIIPSQLESLQQVEASEALDNLTLSIWVFEHWVFEQPQQPPQTKECNSPRSIFSECKQCLLHISWDGFEEWAVEMDGCCIGWSPHCLYYYMHDTLCVL